MRRLLLLFAFCALVFSGSYAQCGDELMKQALGAMGNFQYIKDFDIKLAAGVSKTGSKFSVRCLTSTMSGVSIPISIT